MPQPTPRRTARSSSPGSRRPGQRPVPRVRASAPLDAAETLVRPPAAGPVAPARRGLRRPRMTGRAAVLVLVLAVLTVSYASSMKAYLTQRAHLTDLRQQIAQSESDINALEREKARWRDPAYLQSQARARFGYLMPGETSYVVLGADGKPLESQTTLLPRKSVIVRQPTAWWDTAWQSVLLAGNPPAADAEPDPLTHIDAPAEGH